MLILKMNNVNNVKGCMLHAYLEHMHWSSICELTVTFKDSLVFLNQRIGLLAQVQETLESLRSTISIRSPTHKRGVDYWYCPQLSAGEPHPAVVESCAHIDDGQTQEILRAGGVHRR